VNITYLYERRVAAIVLRDDGIWQKFNMGTGVVLAEASRECPPYKRRRLSIAHTLAIEPSPRPVS
jgi:hypothetical protein